MSLSGSGAADQATIETLLDPLAAGQLHDLLLVQTGHCREVVGVEVLVDAEGGLFDPGLEGRASARRNAYFTRVFGSRPGAEGRSLSGMLPKALGF